MVQCTMQLQPRRPSVLQMHGAVNDSAGPWTSGLHCNERACYSGGDYIAGNIQPFSFAGGKFLVRL